MPPRKRDQLREVFKVGKLKSVFERSSTTGINGNPETLEVASPGVDALFDGTTSTATAASASSGSITGPTPKGSSHDRTTTEWTTACLNGIKTILKIVKEATNGVQVPGVQGIAAGIVATIEVYQNVADNKRDIEATVRLINRIREEIIQPIFSVESGGRYFVSQDLIDRMHHLESDMETIVHSADAKLHSSLVARLANNEADKSTIREMNQSLKDALDAFMLKGLLSLEINAELDRARSVVYRLPDIDAQFDSGSRGGAVGCFPNTRATVLQDVFQWSDNSTDEQPILWLYGVAGIGKSTVAYTVAEKLQKDGRLAASFFFSRDDAQRRSARNLFPSLARQLAFSYMGSMHALSEAIKNNPTIATSAIGLQVRGLLVPAVRGCALGAAGKRIVVIDALDECYPEGDMDEVLSALASEIANISPYIRLLLTSRPEPHIRRKFASQLDAMHYSFVLHDVDQLLVSSDIESYLDHHLQVITEEWRLPPGWYTDSDVAVLVRRAGRLFIVAATSIKFIRDSFSDDPPTQLGLLLTEPTEGGAASLSEVDKLYLSILRSSLPPDGRQYHSFLPKVALVLGAVVLLGDSFSPITLDLLLGFPKGTVRRTVNRLHSILLVPHETEPQGLLRAFHASLPDFLLDPRRCVDTRFLVDQGITHGHLALRCLRVLNAELKRDICAIGDNGKLNEEILDLSSRLDKHVPLYVRYACLHLSYHIINAPKSNVEIQKELSLFCSSHLLEWLEVLSLLEQLPVAPQAVRAMQARMTTSDSDDTLSRLLEELYDVLEEFGECMQQCAQQVYLSPSLFARRGVFTDKYAPQGLVARTVDIPDLLQHLDDDTLDGPKNLSEPMGPPAFVPDVSENSLPFLPIVTKRRPPEPCFSLLRDLFISNDGLRAVVGTDSEFIQYLILEDRLHAVRRICYDDPERRRSFDVSADCRYIVEAVLRDQRLQVHGGDETVILNTPANSLFRRIDRLAISSCGLQIALSHQGHSLHLARLGSFSDDLSVPWHELWTPYRSNSRCTSLDFSPDGNRLLYCSYDSPLSRSDGHRHSVWVIYDTLFGASLYAIQTEGIGSPVFAHGSRMMALQFCPEVDRDTWHWTYDLDTIDPEVHHTSNSIAHSKLNLSLNNVSFLRIRGHWLEITRGLIYKRLCWMPDSWLNTMYLWHYTYGSFGHQGLVAVNGRYLAVGSPAGMLVVLDIGAILQAVYPHSDDRPLLPLQLSKQVFMEFDLRMKVPNPARAPLCWPQPLPDPREEYQEIRSSSMSPSTSGWNGSETGFSRTHKPAESGMRRIRDGDEHEHGHPPESAIAENPGPFVRIMPQYAPGSECYLPVWRWGSMVHDTPPPAGQDLAAQGENSVAPEADAQSLGSGSPIL